ncbi:ImuA family protein [Caulifigura coniformis]|uniref:ImuA family protein n=1 Tax=Caulifigura coniformis TaxID=2527983 RepID=UPI001E487105|nr:hypothetical protein [Caulifigura coniformis]
MATPNHVLSALAHELQRRQAVRAISEGHSSTGASALDQLLPNRGLKAGGLTEWLSHAAEGGLTFALLAASQAMKSRAASVVAIIDPKRQVYPACLPGWGIPLERAVLIRPSSSADALWAWEQSLRCPGMAACLGWLPETSSVALRRLQVAAEHGGGLGLLVRPARAMKEPSWADVRWRVMPVPIVSSNARPDPLRGRRFRVELVRCRSHFGGGVADVEFCPHAANPVRLAPALADPAVALRATGS